MDIDYVVPMVFPDDYYWQQDYRMTGRKWNESSLVEYVRYRSWHNEDLLIPFIRKNLPFVRTIFILLSRESQIKEWMLQDGVRIIFHRDFIPERYLPIFNSMSFEMFLKDIPGLSDYFLYANDDMFPLRPLTADAFFVDGKPRQHWDIKPFPERPNIFHLACRNGLNFVAKEFGMKFTDSYFKGGHGITPIVKATCEHLWQRGRKEIEGSISAFRASYNFIQWIYPWWHMFSGEYAESKVRVKYVSTKNTVEECVNAILRDDVDVICINDNECVEDYERYAQAVRKALEDKLKE